VASYELLTDVADIDILTMRTQVAGTDIDT
jgi:hypothetical protein